MSKNTLTITLCIPIILLMVQCKKIDTTKPKPKLPPITSQGLGTFGCLRDGVVWKPYKSTSEYYRYINNPALRGSLSVVGRTARYAKKQESVTFAKTHLWDTGMYRLRNTEHLPHIRNNYDVGYTYMGCDCQDLTKDKIYESDSTTYGWVHIHCIDTNKRIISGTFEYDAINEKDKTDTIKIRKGRFDHKY